MHRARVILEALLVTLAVSWFVWFFRHDLDWAFPVAIVMCLIGLWLIGNLDRRKPSQEFITVPTKTDGTSFLVQVAENRIVAPIVDAVTTMSGSSARWDAAMEVARTRSDYYAELAKEMPEIPAPPARARDTNRPPNFDDERRDYRDIMTNCDGNGQVWEPVIHALIDRTRAKIEAWNPRHVERFDEPNVTDVSLSLIDGMLHSNEIPTLRDLRQRFERLDRILGKQ